MRVLPAHAPQDRAGRLVSRHEAARTRAAGGRSPRSNSPVCQGRRSTPAHANPWRDRPAAKGPLKGAIDGIAARPHSTTLRRLQGRCGRQPLLCCLVNPGLPGKPFVAGLADRTESPREKYRTASKPFPIRFHACRDRASCLGHLIMTTPILLLPGFRIGGRSVRHRLECALLVGALVPADPGGAAKVRMRTRTPSAARRQNSS